MTLAVIDTVRHALANGGQLRQSDLLALCATAEQLWRQTVTSSTYRTTEHRREYMRLYMRRYRAKARVAALSYETGADSGPSPAS